MQDLEFAIIGAGFWAPYQLAAWEELGGANCVAVCDLVGSKAKALADQHGISRIYEDAEELFKNESLDFVDIITSESSHLPLVRLAAKYGVPTICQKPLAESFEDCQSMAENSRESGVPLMVHENFRWQRPLRHLRGVLETGKVGEVFRARLHYCSSFPVFENQPFLRDLKQFLLTDVGTHILDVARYLFGEAESLYCRIQRVNPTISGEDVATVMLSMRSGSTVLIEMSYASVTEHERFPETYVFVEGNKGSVELGPDFWVRVTTDEGTHSQRVAPIHYDWADPQYDLIHGSVVNCNRNLLAALQNRTTAETSVEDNLKTLQLVFGAYDSARNNQVVHLDRAARTLDGVAVKAGKHRLNGEHGVPTPHLAAETLITNNVGVNNAGSGNDNSNTHAASSPTL